MPRYDFKCKKCGLVVEERMSFDDSEAGIQCKKCEGNMERQFTPCSNMICRWNPPYKPGHDAKEDRRRAFNSQVEKKKLPDNYADLGGK